MGFSVEEGLGNFYFRETPHVIWHRTLSYSMPR